MKVLIVDDEHVVRNNINYAKRCELCDKNHAYKKGVLCLTCRVNVQRFRQRLACIKYLGSKCVRCSWAGHVSGYDIHHKDPDKKEFSFSHANTFPWKAIKTELDKCELLCAFCHRFEHIRASSEGFMNYVYQYSGQLPIGEQDPRLFSVAPPASSVSE